MCLSACYWAHVDRIFYSGTQTDAAEADFDDRFIYEEFAKDKSHRTIPMERICPEKGGEPFKVWETNNAKIEY